MPDQDWIVHLGAALGFGCLGFWVLRLQRDLVFLRRLLRSGFSRGIVYVERPSCFLSKLASSLGIPIEGQLDRDKDPYERIDLAPWLRLHMLSPIQSITCDKMQVIVSVEEGTQNDQTHLDTPTFHNVLVRILKSKSKRAT